MSTAIATLIDEVAGDLSGAPLPTIERQFQRTAVDFCQRTWAWQTTVGPMTTVKDRAKYQVTVDPSLNAIVLAILTMAHRDQILTPRTEEQLDQHYPGWRSDKSKRAQHFVPRQYGEFLLVPMPDETLGRAITNIRVAMYPKRTVTSLPDDIVDEWFEALLAGVRSRMLRMSDREWTNVQMAAVAEQAYEDGVNSAKHQVIHGWGASKHTVPKRPLPGMP